MIRNRMDLKNMTTAQRLWYILKHENEINRKMRYSARSPYLTEALYSAVDILPNERSKRALEYVARNSSAEFHFGGTDAVGPAIKEAISLMIQAKVA